MVRGRLPAGASPVSQEEIDNVAQIASVLDVTEAGARLLAVLMRDGSEKLSMTVKCGLADISQDTYYRLMRDPRMVKAIAVINQGMIQAGTFAATKALVERAAAGDPNCIKVVHEEAGLLQNVQVHKHEHDIGVNMLQLFRENQKKLKQGEVIDVKVIEKG